MITTADRWVALPRNRATSPSTPPTRVNSYRFVWTTAVSDGERSPFAPVSFDAGNILPARFSPFFGFCGESAPDSEPDRLAPMEGVPRAEGGGEPFHLGYTIDALLN
jgi:hypothetical protein